ncbi:hypothetical protein PROFUN_12839 [Planoprotostelium fungivorum]|uniref:Uncharacterized protein n=1 Tax=Planoprotostelium fungivorum TaxID=1890364 RepID=A0A2P6N6K3_9EUKA|nr:hypothetical protein PROFUN_12839 [Planoprotostelium fungivorum]
MDGSFWTFLRGGSVRISLELCYKEEGKKQGRHTPSERIPRTIEEVAPAFDV